MEPTVVEALPAVASLPWRACRRTADVVAAMSPARRYPPRRVSTHNPETEMPRPVVGLDIDGTLGVYHEHFLRFAEGWLGRRLPGVAHGMTVPKYDGSVPLHRWMGVSKQTYRACKMAYRRGGLKRSMPVQPGAADLARGLRRAGAMVIICTTRPFLMLENVDPDTQEWLRRNRIQHDGIIHGEHKYRDLARQYGRRVIMVLEDLPELIDQADDALCAPVQIARPHNLDRLQEPYVTDLTGALQVGLMRIGLYEEHYR